MKRYSSAFFSPMFSSRFIASSVTVLLIVLVFACGTALYMPTVNQETSNASLKDLKDGRAAYINKCGGCHTLIVPEKYTEKDWSLWVDRMEAKASITPAEKEAIVKYLSKGAKQ